MAALSTEDAGRIIGSLTEQVPDPQAIVAHRRTDPDLRRLVAAMVPGDQLWEWHWSGRLGVRDAYSIGYCIVRDRWVVDSHCHSSG